MCHVLCRCLTAMRPVLPPITGEHGTQGYDGSLWRAAGQSGSTKRVDLRDVFPPGYLFPANATTMLQLRAPPSDGFAKLQTIPHLRDVGTQAHLQNVAIGLFGTRGVRSGEPKYVRMLASWGSG